MAVFVVISFVVVIGGLFVEYHGVNILLVSVVDFVVFVFVVIEVPLRH